jgi:hypothetical protein
MAGLYGGAFLLAKKLENHYYFKLIRSLLLRNTLVTQNTSDTVNISQKEPIAIIGIWCRFPGGANSPEAFWKLLRDGVDAITEVPSDRWNLDNFYDPEGAKPGKIRTRWGGFVDKIDEFDAEFFGISPREASSIDPQHRLLLEVAWEALEDGGKCRKNLPVQKPEYLLAYLAAITTIFN